MPNMTPQRLIKAARTLLDWPQHELAKRAGVALSTVARFEAGAGLNPNSLESVLEAFTEAGLDFEVENETIVGIRFPRLV